MIMRNPDNQREVCLDNNQGYFLKTEVFLIIRGIPNNARFFLVIRYIPSNQQYLL